MAKVLTENELAAIVTRAVTEDGLNPGQRAHTHFLEDLASVVADHFGARLLGTDPPMQPKVAGMAESEYAYTALLAATESTPDDGGVFADYDTDKPLDEWLEESGVRRET
jgi:hypothetical protein